MKKHVKKIIAVILLMILVFSLSGCGEVKKAELSVNNMFTSLKKLDFDEAQKYVNVDNIISKENQSTNSVDGKLFMKTLFKHLDYKIISSEKKDDNTVIVKTRITAIDMKPVMGEFVSNAMQYAFSNAFSEPQPSEEETNKKMEEIFITAATKPNLATVTNDVDITVVKDNKNWKIKSNDEFSNALLGGMLEVTKELENSFKTMDEN